MDIVKRINDIISKKPDLKKKDVIERVIDIMEAKTGETISPKTLYAKLNKTRGIEPELIPYFAEALGIPEQDLFDPSKKIDILKEVLKNPTPEALDILKSQYPAISETIEVPILSHEVSAGHGLEPYETEVIDRVVVDKDKFFPGVPPHKIDGVIVKGDSMEPTLYEGDYVFLYRFDWDEEIEKIDDIYVINVDNQLKVKRLNFMLNGNIRVISDNPKYKPEEINPNETQVYFRIIGRVLKKFGKV